MSEQAVRRYPKRLIEVDLPIKRISAHARREKSIRHGHISTLHVWWARRPLAACRAVICAASWPDPADELCPEEFKNVARTLMQRWANDHLKLAGADSYRRLLAIQRSPDRLANSEELRQVLLDFIADFANWDVSGNSAFLDTARSLTHAAHLAMCDSSDSRPLVVDPFAGGGSIPLEAMRIGADVFSSDLNPVAVLLSRVVLDYAPKYGQRLAREVRERGNQIKAQAKNDLTEFYPPDPDGSIPVAYLWARTVQCEGPSCGARIPLIRSPWLAKATSRAVALRLVPDLEGRRVNFQVIENPKDSDLGDGTVRRSAAACPICGFTTPARNVRQQFVERAGGADDAQLVAVVTIGPDSRRKYRTATERDLETVRKAQVELRRIIECDSGIPSVVPEEPLPYLRSIFNINLLGVDRWRYLFTSRQLLTQVTLWRLIRRLSAQLQGSGEPEPEFVRACTTCLALAIDRMSAQNTSLSWWQPKGEFVVGTFGRQALGIIWDFAEIRPIEGASGDLDGAIDWVARVVENLAGVQSAGAQVEMLSASSHPLPDDVADLFVTDPPYYDAVPYADLSDFFYVQLKRMLSDVHPDLFREELTPKRGEIVQLAERNALYSFKTREYFESNMRQALSEARRILKPDGIAVVVFAHKTTEGWEAMLSSLINAGWITTASWPIDTERSVRIRAHEAAALGSSIHLVCRPRESESGSLVQGVIGDWREVLQELPQRIREWMPRLADEGVVGADAIFACLGPALEVFSRYSSVEKPSGERVTLKEYLEHVWAGVAREALTMIFQGADATGFEPDARLTAIWLWTLSTPGTTGSRAVEPIADEDTEDEEPARDGRAASAGYVLEFDAARKIAQGLGVHLVKLGTVVNIKGDTARLLPVSERARFLLGDGVEAPTPRRKRQTQLGLFGEVEMTEEPRAERGNGFLARPDGTTLDRLHQSMILFGSGRGAAFQRLLVEEGVGRDEQFWRLAQALSALYPTGSDEKRWVDGVLARKKALGL